MGFRDEAIAEGEAARQAAEAVREDAERAKFNRIQVMADLEKKQLEKQIQNALAMASNWIEKIGIDPSRVAIEVVGNTPQQIIAGSSIKEYGNENRADYSPGTTGLEWVIDDCRFRANIIHQGIRKPLTGTEWDDANRKRLSLTVMSPPKITVGVLIKKTANGNGVFVKVDTKKDIGVGLLEEFRLT